MVSVGIVVKSFVYIVAQHEQVHAQLEISNHENSYAKTEEWKLPHTFLGFLLSPYIMVETNGIASKREVAHMVPLNCNSPQNHNRW